MTTTYDYLQQAHLLLAELDMCDELVPEDLVARLDAFEAQAPERADKLAALRAVAQLAEGRIGVLRDEEKRIAAKRKRDGRTVERLKEMAVALLEAEEALTGKARLETPTCTFRLQKNSQPSLIGPEEPGDWPQQFHVTRLSLDKRAALAAMKQTPDKYPELSLETGRHLRWT